MTAQCKSCPWRVDCDPDADIPNYRRDLHEGLTSCIAKDASLDLGAPVRAMACHYSKPGKEFPCAGWLDNQLGPGNNIPLRLVVMVGRLPVPTVDGKQHETFEDTLPRRGANARAVQRSGSLSRRLDEKPDRARPDRTRKRR